MNFQDTIILLRKFRSIIIRLIINKFQAVYQMTINTLKVAKNSRSFINVIKQLNCCVAFLQHIKDKCNLYRPTCI